MRVVNPDLEIIFEFLCYNRASFILSKRRSFGCTGEIQIIKTLKCPTQISSWD